MESSEFIDFEGVGVRWIALEIFQRFFSSFKPAKSNDQKGETTDEEREREEERVERREEDRYTRDSWHN